MTITFFISNHCSWGLDCDNAFECEDMSVEFELTSINLKGYKSGINMDAAGQDITATGAYAAQGASFSDVHSFFARGSHSV